jgi:L-alanine-DL-glutamate epimerase-like enolase superfamily enzyme
MALIEQLRIHRLTVPLRRPFVTAVRAALLIDVLLVEVRDSDGRCGWGEAPTSWRVTGESPEGVSAALSGPLIEAVRGLASDDIESSGVAIERAVVHNSAARMALDCALFDLAAQVRGVPLFQFLGGSARDIRTDMTLSAVVNDADLATLVQTAHDFVDAGFSTLKVKAGAGGDDVKTLVEVRRAIGENVRLRVDANQGWSPDRAIQIIKALEDAGVGVELVEQPVGRDNIDGLALVTSQVETPIMADESVWTSRDLREIIRSHAADMINVKLAKTGGLRGAIDLASVAQENGVHVIVGCMAESHVGIAAGAALASALKGSQQHSPEAQDLDGGLLLSFSPVLGGVTYQGERLLLSDSPGIGILGLAAT